jgi:hypothetical protein
LSLATLCGTLPSYFRKLSFIFQNQNKSGRYLAASKMCIEVFNKYDCACQESIDLLFCPSLQEIHHLIDIEGVSEHSNTIRKLYRQCEKKSAQRFEWRKVGCDSCGSVVTPEKMSELILKDFYDAENADDSDNGHNSNPRSRNRKGKSSGSIEDDRVDDGSAEEGGEVDEDEYLSDEAQYGSGETERVDGDYSDSLSSSPRSSSLSPKQLTTSRTRRATASIVAQPQLDTIYEEQSSSGCILRHV